MGYDVSYHPISEQQINAWYFEAIEHPEKVEELAVANNLEEFYKTKYQDTINAGRETDQSDYFDKTHGFFIAVVQGFFETYFYIRGAALSFSGNKQLDVYYKKWEQFVPQHMLTGKVRNRLIENYCSGVFIPAEQVAQLLVDYDCRPSVRSELDHIFSEGRIAIFLKALHYAKERGLGLLEATEVVEPQPLDLNESKSYSNLSNCDQEGPLLYQQMAFIQIGDIEQRNNTSGQDILQNVKIEKVQVQPAHMTTTGNTERRKYKGKGFWKRLFG